jgi:hypothetical protein
MCEVHSELNLPLQRQRIDTTQLMKRKQKSCTHGLKKPVDAKLFQWVSSIRGKNFGVAFKQTSICIRWVVSIRWKYFLRNRLERMFRYDHPH